MSPLSSCNTNYFVLKAVLICFVISSETKSKQSLITRLEFVNSSYDPSNKSFMPRLVLIELRKRFIWMEGSEVELKPPSIAVSFY